MPSVTGAKSGQTHLPEAVHSTVIPVCCMKLFSGFSDMVDDVIPNDTGKDLAAVLSYLVGRTLSKEEVWKAMELPRSTYYDQLEKGTLISSDNLGRAATNLGINRAELLTRYRFIDPEEITALADEMQKHPTVTATAQPEQSGGAAVLEMRRRADAPPL